MEYSTQTLKGITHFMVSKGAILLCLFLSSDIVAQIPQNIEVEGEPEKGWQYLLYILALLLVFAVVFIILRIVKKKDPEK